MTIKNKNELKRITNIFLNPNDNYGELFKAADEFYKLLLSVSDLKPDESICRDDIYLSSGKAIGPVWAAMCVKEFMRTKRFISGIFKAVKDARKQFPNQKIHILYAGTGPFATLGLPLSTAFTCEEISFTFLEINPHSIECLKKTIKAFGIEDYIKDIVCCDATEYKADKNQPIHMIITETMLNALQKEPQVAITMNLVPQMVEEGILIPQQITVEAGILNSKRFKERMMGKNQHLEDHLHIIKKIFIVNKDVNNIKRTYDLNDNSCIFEEEEVILPNNLSKDYNQLNLFTTIQIYKDEFLTNWQCSLNLPQKIIDLNAQEKQIKKVNYRYVISSTPKFEYTII